MTAVYKTEAGGQEVRERYAQTLRDWPVPYEHRRVATREGETFVVVCGPEDAPPLLLFHGSGTNAAMWTGDVAVWAEHFRVHAVDMIGEPGLSAPARPPLDSEAYARWLDDVLDGLEVTRAAVVGASLGGWLALDYATRRPDRVSCLALLCPGRAHRVRGQPRHHAAQFHAGRQPHRREPVRRQPDHLQHHPEQLDHRQVLSGVSGPGRSPARPAHQESPEWPITL